MPHTQEGTALTTWLGVAAVLFGLLLLANQGTELLKQWVIAPGTSAALGLPADCRPDELEEEALSLEECELMVASVRIALASSPDWFRPLQLLLSASGSLAAILTIAIGAGLAAGRRRLAGLAPPVFTLLLILDVVAFVAAVNTGPLLRAQYLWPTLLWIAIHLCLLTVALRCARETEAGTP